MLAELHARLEALAPPPETASELASGREGGPHARQHIGELEEETSSLQAGCPFWRCLMMHAMAQHL